MKSLNLCIDIDGTITEPYYWLASANAYFKSNLQPEDVTMYEIHKLLGVDQAIYHNFYQQNCEQLHSEADIRIGVHSVLTNLHNHHYLHFVTAREEKLTDISVQWLQKHQIPLDSITHLGSHYKVEKALELQADFFIEDRYENALELAEAGIQVLLIDCSYNRGYLPHNVFRVSHWFQIEKIIGDHSRRVPESLKLVI
ncbi:MAG: hypothetical protein HGA49_03770 [Eubacteriaceae bacterium]|nr:hypothetical protein [Eubacteriaceae bacterium]